MVTGVDHVALTLADADGAARAYAVLLGAAPTADGRRRFQMFNSALEIGEGEGETPLFGLGLTSDDPEATLARLERRGVPRAGDRLSLAATHGVPIRIVAADPVVAHATGADAPHAIDHIVVHTPNPERAVALYGGRLGLDLRLDRSNPQWGSRLLFFRCGAAVLEISASLDAPVTDGPDRITGLAWRVADPAAAQARLAAAGLNVSEVRKGRKPGTAVFTVRSGVPGAPALVIGGAGAEG